jgi:plastocyanin
MQFKALALVASAIILGACGGSDTAPAADPAAAAPAATTTAAYAAPTGQTHEVKMVLTAAGAYAFEPANLTIKAGDAVKFVAVSGFPHNVAFDGTGLAANVAAQLDANFGTAKAGTLMSNMFVAANESITISFANVPAGTYNFNCTPHLAMNMKGTITVQ